MQPRNISALLMLIVIGYPHVYFKLAAAQTCDCTVSTPGRGSICTAISARNNCLRGTVCPCSVESISTCEGQTVNCVRVDVAANAVRFCPCLSSGDTCTDDPTSFDCLDDELCDCTSFGLQGSGDINGICPGNQGSTAQQGSCLTISTAHGINDPHFTGFDGTRFDFHGQHKHNYVIYAEKEADFVTAKLRATEELNKGVNKTYFDEFGVYMADRKEYVHIYMTPTSAKMWKLNVLYINGNTVKQGTNVKLSATSKVLHHSDGRGANVVTKLSVFKFRIVSPESDYRHHLDFSMSKTSNMKHSSHYAGVLGMTLNRKLGGDIHDDVFRTFDVDRTDNYFSLRMEAKLRRSYEVFSLFPTESEINELYMQ